MPNGLFKEGGDSFMQTVINKILKVVESCVTPEQLEIAGHLATLAKKQINQDQWLDIACAIQSKASEMLFYDLEDLVILRRAHSFNELS
jgi:hypothetical protein